MCAAMGKCSCYGRCLDCFVCIIRRFNTVSCDLYENWYLTNL